MNLQQYLLKYIMFRIIVVSIIRIALFKFVDGIDSKCLDNDIEYREVTTNYGIVRGHRASDGDHFAYLGIPYAEPPLGDNRFKAPLPPSPWKDVYEANRTVVCPQRGIGEEDCLYLNILTPINIYNGPLPVLFYIHGGSFLIGTAYRRGMEPLMKQNIIVVSINYRLGALGFLCLGIEEAPGNAGMKDQVAALTWVQENIVNFGGDPNQVTIFGTSAGGASVELLVLTNMNNGLFQKAIVESASATSVWVVNSNPIQTARDVAALLDFPIETRDILELVDYFKHIPADKLSEINYEYYSDLIDGTFGFVPCIERDIDNSKAFLTESPYEILLKEKFKKLPTMFIFATLEGLFLRSSEYYERNYKDRMEANFDDFIPADLSFDTPEIRKEISNSIKYFYFGNRTVSNETILEYLNYFGDNLILHGLLNSVDIHAKNGNPVYLTEFAYKGNMANSDKFYDDIKIAGHADMKHYVLLNKPLIDDNDKLIVMRISELIANFVKFG